LPHVTRLRIHTRLPVVLPERIDTFLAWLAALPLQKVVVLHANHANESMPASMPPAPACAMPAPPCSTSRCCCAVVNDDRCLAELSEQLFAAGVLPYYLHQLDRVQGTAHFEVDDARALELVDTPCVRGCRAIWYPGWCAKWAARLSKRPSKTRQWSRRVFRWRPLRNPLQTSVMERSNMGVPEAIVPSGDQRTARRPMKKDYVIKILFIETRSKRPNRSSACCAIPASPCARARHQRRTVAGRGERAGAGHRDVRSGRQTWTRCAKSCRLLDAYGRDYSLLGLVSTMDNQLSPTCSSAAPVASRRAASRSS
jgi:hypothetical protein